MPLEQIPYIDYPELRIDEHESTEMPFRYVKDASGLPVMPEVSERIVIGIWELESVSCSRADKITELFRVWLT